MADTPHDHDHDHDDAPELSAGVPVEGAEEVESLPRRAASAQFEVDAGVGAEVLMREAMDPANQSLRDALRLSYRVLQVVILVLIVLFIFSGFKTVESQQTGVLLRWGKILTVNGSEALDKGLQFSWWPYPAGEFVLFTESDRRVNLGTYFWPRMRPGQSLEDAVSSSSVNNFLRPGMDGSVLTKGGDIAHIQLQAQDETQDPVAFVKCVENKSDHGLDADKLVDLALKRATVHTAAKFDLDSFVEFSDTVRAELDNGAQSFLDGVNCGIHLADVSTPLDPMPVFSIKQAYGTLQEAQGNASNAVEQARQDSTSMLVGVVGDDYRKIIDLMDRYEQAVDADSADAPKLLEQINTIFESDSVSGEVAKIIKQAQSYRNTVDLTLRPEAQRLESLLPAYRKHPQQVISRLWAEAYEQVFTQSDSEVFRVPDSIGSLRISLSGYNEVREKRRKDTLDRKERGAWVEGEDIENPTIYGVRDRQVEGPGRQLNEQGKAKKNE
jgi:modulator of FtsH protease HflK